MDDLNFYPLDNKESNLYLKLLETHLPCIFTFSSGELFLHLLKECYAMSSYHPLPIY